jgi:hypothetical protein
MVGKIFRSKYYRTGKIVLQAKYAHTTNNSIFLSFWKGVMSTYALVQTSINKKVYNCMTVNFLYDRWLKLSIFATVYPLLYSIVQNSSLIVALAFNNNNNLSLQFTQPLTVS